MDFMAFTNGRPGSAATIATRLGVSLKASPLSGLILLLPAGSLTLPALGAPAG
jgi:hypothetical protein